MIESADTLQRVASFLGDALRPFVSSLGSEGDVLSFVEELGWSLPLVPPSIPALGAGGNAVVDALADVETASSAFAEGTSDGDAVTRALVVLLAQLGAFALQTRELRAKLAQELPPDVVAATGIADAFQKRLFEDLVVRAIGARAPLGTALAGLAGIVEEFDVAADPARLQPDYTHRAVRLDRIGALLNDPKSILRDVYGWGTPTLDLDRLFTNIARVSYPLLGPIELRYPSDALLASTAPGAPISEDDGPPPAYTIPIYEGDPITIVLAVLPLPKLTPQELQGVAITLMLELGADAKLALSPMLTLALDGTLDLASGVAAVMRPDRDPAIMLDPEGATPAPITGKGGARLTFSDPDKQPTRLLTIPGGSFFETTELYVAAGVDAAAAPPDVWVQAGVTGGVLTISASDADSFLSSILPADGLTTHFDFGIEWSQRRGLRFSGGAHLDTTIPLNVRLGPFTVQSTHVEVTADRDGLTLELSASGSAMVGPINASVDRLGIILQSTFRDGNLGPFDLAVGFKPPTGVGLVIDASVVLGGGFLRFDPQKGEYSGILQLEIAEKISVKAIGLLNTRMPDGSKGYSLVLIIFAEGFTPIQLGLGFALTGIGGLLAINRTFAEEALRSGLKNHTLDSVMFPHDPIRNAPQIISNLNKVFPPAAGHHLFGPMVQIAWGTPPLITAEVGVVLELGARLRLLILAQIAAILPRRDNDLVRLQMDAIGILDFDQGTAALDATLYDSRLLKKFVLTGDMAMRLKWEGSPHFALSVGGLHPAFQPPPNFPKLERIAINLSSGDNPRLRCESYFAITSNTVQFGARAELYAAAAGFSIHGDIGYDVLIQFDPFFFLAEFHAQLQLKRGSSNLFKVRLEGSLAGPRPLHLKGKATFEILWWDVSIRVDTTLVKGEKPPAPEPIDVLPRLREALGHPDNWVTQLPLGQRPVVTLSPRPESAEILLHPLGTLQVKENVVPLNMEISRFGQAAPAGDRHFTITGVSVGGDNQVPRTVRDFFAPAQFIEMSDDEKLSRPSFEPMDAGVSFVSDAIVFTTDTSDWLEAKAIEFETWILDKGTNVAESADEEDPQGVKLFYQLSPTLLGKQARFGAAGNSELRRTGKAKYRTTIAKHSIAKEGWTIVTTDDLTVQPVTGVEGGGPMSYSEAVQELQQLKQQAPAKAGRLKILRPSELARK